MAYTFTRTGAQIEEIHNTVEDPKSNAQFSDDIRAIAGEYRGLWPDTGGSADKGDTYQTQVSGTPTGQYFTALQNTTVDPVGDDVNWRSLADHNALINRDDYGAHPASSISTADSRSVQERLDDLPSEVDAAGTAATLISQHNSDATAHPDLSAFITAEAGRAETASDVAMAAGWVYADVVSGEAARVDGEYFWVVSADDSEVLELWEMGATTATDTGKRTVSKNFSFQMRGNLPAASSLSSASMQGCYPLTANAGYTDLPPDYTSSGIGYLLVYPVSENSRFYHQELREFNNPIHCWVRRMDTSGSSTDWVYEQEVSDNSVTTDKILNQAVTRQKLGSSYKYNTLINSGSINDINWLDGTYLVVTSSVSDLPVGINGTAVLEVSQAASWSVQEISSFDNPDQRWWRVIRFGQSSFGEWVKVNDASITSPFSSKNIVFFGDSITENGDYPTRVGARLGANIADLGIGGTRIGVHSSTYDPFSMYNLAGTIASGDYVQLQADADTLLTEKGKNVSAQVTAMSNIDWNTVDYIVMFYGTNDYNGNTPLGSLTDTGGATIRGAVNTTVSSILTAYPHIRLLFVGPMYRDRMLSGDGENSDDFTNTSGIKLIEYSDAIIDAANNNHHIPALDMYRNSCVNRYTASTYLVDGLHPIAGIGYQLVADKISSFMGANY